MHAVYTSLLARVTDLRARLTVAKERRWVRADLRDLTLDVGRTTSEVLDIVELDVAMNSDATVDAAALERAFEPLRKVSPTDFQMPGSSTFSAEARLQTLSAFVESAKHAETLPALEWMLRRSMIGDGQFDGLLIALNNHDDVRDAIRTVVREKLDVMSDVDAVDLLGRYAAETHDAREVRVELDASVTTESFFRVASPAEARERAAEYVVLVRPKLERLMFQRGKHYTPGDFVGIATIVCWRPATAGRTKFANAQVLSTVSRVAACWVSGVVGDRESSELAAALRVDPNGYVISGRGMKGELEALGDVEPTAEGLLAELEKLLRFAADATASQPVEEALRAYKAGLEVFMPESLSELKEHGEIWLQRHACRFLVERGHAVTGASFGRDEVDLRAQDGVGSVLVEAKKKGDGPITESELRGWLAQLMTYMNDEPLHSRGVLLVFNFTGATLLAPRGYVHGRFLILAINLGEPTASQRIESVVVEESTDPRTFINVRRNAVASRRSEQAI